MKTCKCCGQDLPLSMFPTNHHHRYADGHLPICLDCFNARCELISRRESKPAQEAARKERKRPIHNSYTIRRVKAPRRTEVKSPRRTEVKAPRRKMTDEERRAKWREYQRAYYRAHADFRDRKREISKRWRKEHPERWAKMQRDYYERKREQLRAYQRAYYLRKKSEKSLKNQKEDVYL